MGNDDITHQILLSIRDEIRSTRTDLTAEIKQTREELGARIDTTNQRVDGLERRMTENEIRIRTELVAIAGTLNDVAQVLRSNLELRDRVAAVEHDVAELKRRN